MKSCPPPSARQQSTALHAFHSQKHCSVGAHLQCRLPVLLQRLQPWGWVELWPPASRAAESPTQPAVGAQRASRTARLEDALLLTGAREGSERSTDPSARFGRPRDKSSTCTHGCGLQQNDGNGAGLPPRTAHPARKPERSVSTKTRQAAPGPREPSPHRYVPAGILPCGWKALICPRNTSTGGEGSAAVTARKATALGVSAGGADGAAGARSAPTRGAPTLRKEKLGPQYLPYIGSATGGSEGGALHNGAGPAPPGSRCEKLRGKGRRDPPGWGLRVPVRPPAQEGPRAALISLPGPEPRPPAHKGL